MHSDKFKPVKSNVNCVMSNLISDSYMKGMKGEVFWKLEENGKIISEGQRNNIVTLDASILIARLIKGTGFSTPHQSEPNFGIYALAVGTGDISWDINNPPAATNTQRSLFNEIARTTISSTSFITSTGSISSIPTNIVDFNFSFGTGQAVGPLCEMGLIGGDIDPILSNTNPVLPPNGSYDPTVSLVGKDTLVNYLTFPVINKGSGATLTWTWRLTF